MKQKNCPISVTKEVYLKLVEIKFNSRRRSIDDVLRVQLGLIPRHSPVKKYSDESRVMMARVTAGTQVFDTNQ